MPSSVLTEHTALVERDEAPPHEGESDQFDSKAIASGWIGCILFKLEKRPGFRQTYLYSLKKNAWE